MSYTTALLLTVPLLAITIVVTGVLIVRVVYRAADPAEFALARFTASVAAIPLTTALVGSLARVLTGR